jgi:hypothetical protein
MAYESWTSTRRHNPAATRDLATQRAVYAAVVSLLEFVFGFVFLYFLVCFWFCLFVFCVSAFGSFAFLICVSPSAYWILLSTFGGFVILFPAFGSFILSLRSSLAPLKPRSARCFCLRQFYCFNFNSCLRQSLRSFLPSAVLNFSLRSKFTYQNGPPWTNPCPKRHHHHAHPTRHTYRQ